MRVLQWDSSSLDRLLLNRHRHSLLLDAQSKMNFAQWKLNILKFTLLAYMFVVFFFFELPLSPKYMFYSNPELCCIYFFQPTWLVRLACYKSQSEWHFETIWLTLGFEALSIISPKKTNGFKRCTHSEVHKRTCGAFRHPLINQRYRLFCTEGDAIKRFLPLPPTTCPSCSPNIDCLLWGVAWCKQWSVRLRDKMWISGQYCTLICPNNRLCVCETDPSKLRWWNFKTCTRVAFKMVRYNHQVYAALLNEDGNPAVEKIETISI